MVKTNRFVKITPEHGLPGVLIVAELWCHFVVFGNNSVENIRGHVLGIHLTRTAPDQPSPADELKNKFVPCALMMLRHDLEVFCKRLMQEDLYVHGYDGKCPYQCLRGPGAE